VLFPHDYKPKDDRPGAEVLACSVLFKDGDPGRRLQSSYIRLAENIHSAIERKGTDYTSPHHLKTCWEDEVAFGHFLVDRLILNFG
jgi:hypothetical protein